MIKVTRSWVIVLTHKQIPIAKRIIRLISLKGEDGIESFMDSLAERLLQNHGVNHYTNEPRVGSLLMTIKRGCFSDYCYISNTLKSNGDWDFLDSRIKPSTKDFIVDLTKPKRLYAKSLKLLLDQFEITDLNAPIRLPLNPIHSEPLPLP